VLNNLFLQNSKMALFDMTIMEVSEYIMPYPVGHTKFFSENHLGEWAIASHGRGTHPPV
jgi:hypothetical protein